MKVVVDTNVVVSAARRDRDPETVILFIVEQPTIQWIVSDAILQEYRSVLQHDRFKLPRPLIEKWFSMLDRTTTLVTVATTLSFPRDQKDAHFLACCLAAGADFFITGDRDFEDAQKLVQTKIVSLYLFKKLLIDLPGT